jgi:hypothetical protein
MEQAPIEPVPVCGAIPVFTVCDFIVILVKHNKDKKSTVIKCRDMRQPLFGEIPTGNDLNDIIYTPWR